MAAGKDDFTRDRLEAEGFLGWVTFDRLDGLLAVQIPAVGGVYVVMRVDEAPATYLEANPGGRFKGRDPSVSTEALEANWVAGAAVVYIGKANKLRRRLREYKRFGQGVPIGHWGGRLIWQLAESAKLLVAWKETPDEAPTAVESRLIEEFRSAHGKPPFANEPHRLGS
jgi:hypothetical protein